LVDQQGATLLLARRGPRLVSFAYFKFIDALGQPEWPSQLFRVTCAGLARTSAEGWPSLGAASFLRKAPTVPKWNWRRFFDPAIRFLLTTS